VRALRNRSIRSAVKTKVTKFRRAVAESADGLEELAVSAVSVLDRAASKGVLHRNNAARRKARLMKRLNATASAAAAPAKATAPAKSGKSAKSGTSGKTTATRATKSTKSTRTKPTSKR
jgi:small subunit ribosomal protein S20